MVVAVVVNIIISLMIGFCYGHVGWLAGWLAKFALPVSVGLLFRHPLEAKLSGDSLELQRSNAKLFDS